MNTSEVHVNPFPSMQEAFTNIVLVWALLHCYILSLTKVF